MCEAVHSSGLLQPLVWHFLAWSVLHVHKSYPLHPSTRLAMSWGRSGPHLQPAHSWVGHHASPKLSCYLCAATTVIFSLPSWWGGWGGRAVMAGNGPQESRCCYHSGNTLPPPSLGLSLPLLCSMRVLLFHEKVFLICWHFSRETQRLDMRVEQRNLIA